MTQFWKGGLIVFFGLMLFVLMTSKGTKPGGVSKTQDAGKGKDVTLDCQVESDLIVFIKSVEWRFNDKVNVLVYKSKGFSHADQDEKFRGRAYGGKSWNFNKGNLPLKIKVLQESDAGIYSCSVSTGEDPKKIISIKLNVEAVNKDQQAQDQTTKNQSSGPVILILCLLWVWQHLHY
ncbi:hypothetical protein OYC64_001281 [Pagothenia borchgrevinki]|uniref:Ig-like domain-containing protein n=1 Tax=Pagothenia borchgrevinki TaxID=8213 RepID=A0ABD2GAG4_PAGBO